MLDELREKIDSLDAQILHLLNERAQIAMKIGEIKRYAQASCYVPEREKIIFEELMKKNQGPLPDKAVRAIYREIISATRSLEKVLAIAFLGPRDTFSHMASLRIFGVMATYQPMASVSDVFTEVERKRADYGVVPVETAMGGGVGDTLDRFISSDLKIVNEVMLHITQNLVSKSPLESIGKVYSKDQSFVQCRNWLKANLPTAELVETYSTAEAARLAAEEPGVAAIASELAAQSHKINVLAAGIEDVPYNYTRFFVIGQTMAKPTGHDKTSVLCSIKDRPGALYALLLPLASHGINLTRIESRPSQKKAWEYVFFIDMMGHVDQPDVAEALDNLAKECTDLKVLGSFPCGKLED